MSPSLAVAGAVTELLLAAAVVVLGITVDCAEADAVGGMALVVFGEGAAATAAPDEDDMAQCEQGNCRPIERGLYLAVKSSHADLSKCKRISGRAGGEMRTPSQCRRDVKCYRRIIALTLLWSCYSSKLPTVVRTWWRGGSGARPAVNPGPPKSSRTTLNITTHTHTL